MSVFRLDKGLALPDEPLFLDTSAWMPCLYAAEQLAYPARAAVYPPLLEKQQKGACRICTCVTQISEYWNRRLHKEHAVWQKTNKSLFGSVGFKAFRNNYPDDYRHALDVTNSEVYELLAVTTLLNPLERIHADEVVHCADEYSVDFNDALYFLICKRFQLTLVTEDNDFLPFVEKINIATTSDKYPL